MFSTRKGSDTLQNEPAGSLFRVVQQLLEAYALHSVEFDTEEQAAFRVSIRQLAERFDKVEDHRDLLILAGETNKTIQSYNQLAEKFIRELFIEKHLAVQMLAQSLIRVCQASEKASQSLQQIERDLAKTSHLQDMRQLRAKLSDCLATLCLEAEGREAQFRNLKEEISASNRLLEQRDEVTGLTTLKSAESRIKEISASGRMGYVMAFFLKNVDLINRRFGFSAGDGVLRKFGEFLGKHLKANDQLFRWRGPCFVMIVDRLTSLDDVKSDAYRIGALGPQVEVEADGKSMLIRLMAATAAFAIPKDQDFNAADLSAKIDRFAAEQFKLKPTSSGSKGEASS